MGLLHFIHRILAFQGTLTVVTILAAFVVWALYNKQRRDQRADAAKTVLREIERAEGQLPELKKALKAIANNGIPDSLRLMTVDNWNSAQYILAGKLPDDVIVSINNFYTYCRLIDQSLEFIDGAFSKNESAVRENAFRVNADYAVKLLDSVKDNPTSDPIINAENESAAAQIKEKLEAFNQKFPTQYTYRPIKPTNDIKKYMDLLPLGLSQGRVGNLLRLAKLSRTKRILAGEWIIP